MEATMSQLEKLEQLAISLHCDVRNQEPMRKHTTFKIGGSCKILININSSDTLAEILKFLKKQMINRSNYNS